MPIQQNLQRDQIPAERDRLAAAAREILDRSTGNLSDVDQAAYDELMADLEALKTRDEALERIERLAAAGGSEGVAQLHQRRTATTVTRDVDPWDPAEQMPIRDRAARALERSGDVPDAGKEKLTRALEGRDGGSVTAMARWLSVTSDPAYTRAVEKLLADPMNGHREFDNHELAAYRRAQDLNRDMKVGVDAQGGFLAPTHLDPAIILTSTGSVSPIRQISRVVTIATDTWNGVTSTGATAEWIAESTEVADGSPPLAQPSIKAEKADVFVPFSFELQGDGADLLAQLRMVMADAKDQHEAAAFVTGDGAGKPFGVVNALPAGSKVATAAADVLAMADVVKPQNALPSRWQPRARWGANLTTLNQIAAFETAGGALRFPEVANDRLLRKPLHEVSHLNTAGNTAAAGNDNVLLYGDFQQYVIVDRVGTTVELVPHLFGTNRRPTGQRGLLLWWRVGAKRVVDDAFRLLTA